MPLSQSKKLLLSEEYLREKAAAVINSEWWDRFISYTKSHILDTSTMTPGIQQGIQLLEHAMKEITIVDKEITPPHIGLEHDLTVIRQGDKATTQKTKE
jgi:hypothetical protein